LSIKYSKFNEYFYDNDEFVKYKESFNNIISIESTNDVELEFKINKENDTRKAKSSFIVHCCIHNAAFLKPIFSFIMELLNNSTQDELFEHLFILCNPELKNKINEIINIKEYILKAIKNDKLNKKSKFKLMDILDKF
jgi:hypothetical protein